MEEVDRVDGTALPIGDEYCGSFAYSVGPKGIAITLPDRVEVNRRLVPCNPIPEPESGCMEKRGEVENVLTRASCRRAWAALPRLV